MPVAACPASTRTAASAAWTSASPARCSTRCASLLARGHAAVRRAARIHRPIRRGCCAWRARAGSRPAPTPTWSRWTRQAPPRRYHPRRHPRAGRQQCSGVVRSRAGRRSRSRIAEQNPRRRKAGLDHSDRWRREQGKRSPHPRALRAASRGGSDADIVVIPTASRLADTGRATNSCFASSVPPASPRWTSIRAATATSPAGWHGSQQATGIFFTGGNQLRLSTTARRHAGRQTDPQRAMRTA